MIVRFFYRLSMKYRQFMIGRYGSDELNLFLVFIALALLILSRLPYMLFMYFVSFAILIYALFRMYSRNIAKRYEEKTKFLKIKNKITSWKRIKSEAHRNRKTHKYFRCKKCKASIRVPKGVGKIEVSCPKCRHKVIKKV